MKNHEINAHATATDFQLWGSRCWYWQDQTDRNKTRRGARERLQRPLILTGHGVALRVEGGSLAISDGLTHYPQKRKSYRYFNGDLDLPERIILMDCKGSISFDAISWLAAQGVAIIKITWRGEVISVVGNSAHAANPYRLQWQRETRADHDLRMNFCNSLIARKIEASILTLEKWVRPRSANWEKAMCAAYATLTKLQESPPQTVEALRIVEANAAVAYFRAWRGIPIMWAKRPKRPIPEDWAVIGTRGSPLYSVGNRNATHPANAILNYAYSLLESEIRITAVADGYDPTLGIMHEGRHGSPAFVFDLMELKRPEIDAGVLKFVTDRVFHPADFVIRSDGVCRLNPEMARCLGTTLSSARRQHSK